jgi:hypothetical protein
MVALLWLHKAREQTAGFVCSAFGQRFNAWRRQFLKTRPAQAPHSWFLGSR